MGFGWWSHDIGGFGKGEHDDALMVRWTEFGVFSPICRLHSTNNPYMSKEPWNYAEASQKAIVKYLRLRHELLPYTYTMNHKCWSENITLVRPLYYYCKGQRNNKNEYFFGDDFLVNPITSKADEVTHMGKCDIHLPEGLWFDFFTTRAYKGDRDLKVFRAIDEIPVFVKAGAVIPRAILEKSNETENPQSLQIDIFPGANGAFDLYKDDGETMGYENGKSAHTNMSFAWGEKSEFVISKPIGDLSSIPEKRNYTLRFRKIAECKHLTVLQNGKECKFEKDYNGNTLTIRVFDICGELRVMLENIEMLKNDSASEADQFLRKAKDERKHIEYAFEKFLASDIEFLCIADTLACAELTDFYAYAVETAKKMNIKTLVDIDGEALKLALCKKPDIIKPNIDEYSCMTGVKVQKIDITHEINALFKNGISHPIIIPVVDIKKEGGGRANGSCGNAAYFVLSDSASRLRFVHGTRLGNVSATTLGSITAVCGMPLKSVFDLKGETVISDMLISLARGLFLFEAGCTQYTAKPGEKIKVGTKILSAARGYTPVTVRFTIGGITAVFDFVTPGDGTTSADTPLELVGGGEWQGAGALKCLNSEICEICISNGKKTQIVKSGDEVELTAGKYQISVTAGNTAAAKWLVGNYCGCVSVNFGGTYLTLESDTKYLEDGLFYGEVNIEESASVRVRTEALGRAEFGEVVEFKINIK